MMAIMNSRLFNAVTFFLFVACLVAQVSSYGMNRAEENKPPKSELVLESLFNEKHESRQILKVGRSWPGEESLETTVFAFIQPNYKYEDGVITEQTFGMYSVPGEKNAQLTRRVIVYSNETTDINIDRIFFESRTDCTGVITGRCFVNRSNEWVLVSEISKEIVPGEKGSLISQYDVLDGEKQFLYQGIFVISKDYTTLLDEDLVVKQSVIVDVGKGQSTPFDTSKIGIGAKVLIGVAIITASAMYYVWVIRLSKSK